MHKIIDYACTCKYSSCILYSGCSFVGLDKSTHYRYVRVDADCSSSKALLHTLFHILGRYHEHERADREEYVDTIEKNIIEGIAWSHTIYTRSLRPLSQVVSSFMTLRTDMSPFASRWLFNMSNCRIGSVTVNASVTFELCGWILEWITTVS